MSTVDHIELHDSMVTVRDDGSGELILDLLPAHVHHWEHAGGNWRGVGRLQDARIRIAAGIASPAAPRVACEVSDGWLRVGDQTYDNLVPVPANLRGPVSGRLILVGGDPVDITGAALSIELIGNPRDIESLPDEWAPKLAEPALAADARKDAPG